MSESIKSLFLQQNLIFWCAIFFVLYLCLGRSSIGTYEFIDITGEGILVVDTRTGEIEGCIGSETYLQYVSCNDMAKKKMK